MLSGGYPRKVGKQDAIKSIEKSIATISKRPATKNHDAFDGDIALAADWVKARTTLYANSPQGRRNDREHIPHPATWFNGARYDDDADEWNHVGMGRGLPTGPSVQFCGNEQQDRGFADVLSRPDPAWVKAGAL